MTLTQAMGCSILHLAALVSALGGLVFGYELGIISGALLQLKAEFRLSCVQQEALVSSLLIGALLASVVGGFLIDRHGRRNSILLSNVLILTGSLVLVLSSFPALVIGRTTVGFAMCISSMSCCIFVSEMVTPDRRGFLVTLYEAGITLGILAAYFINYILFDSRGGWRWMFGLAVVPTLLQLVSIWSLPSSTEKAPNADGCEAERNLRNPLVTQESDDLSSCRDNERVPVGIMYLFQREDNMATRTAIGLGLVLFQQFTGQPNILFYASTVFHAVGFQSDASAVLASVGLGLVKVLATGTSMVFSDRVGRRPLLISGCCVMAACLITIGLLSGRSVMNATRPCSSEDLNNNITSPTAANQSVLDVTLTAGVPHEQPDTSPVAADQQSLDSEGSAGVHGALWNWVIFVCMMAVVGAYAVGFGPMTWLLLSEIFPAAVRGRAFAFTNCFNWAANLMVTFTFLNVIDWIGLSGVFVLYGLTAAGAGIFFYFMLPETKGKSLQQIDEELRLNRISHCEWSCIRLRNPPPHYQKVHYHVSTLE